MQKSGLAILACLAYPASLAATVLAGASVAEGGIGDTFKKTVSGTFNAVKRLLTVESPEGAVYGVLTFGALAGAAWWGVYADPTVRAAVHSSVHACGILFWVSACCGPTVDR